jgi:hypothetical protein
VLVCYTPLAVGKHLNKGIGLLLVLFLDDNFDSFLLLLFSLVLYFVYVYFLSFCRAEAFSKNFQSVCSSSCPGNFPFINQSTEVLSGAPVSNSDVHNAIKRLRPAKSVGLDGAT